MNACRAGICVVGLGLAWLAGCAEDSDAMAYPAGGGAGDFSDATSDATLHDGWPEAASVDASIADSADEEQDGAGIDAGPEAAVDHSDQLPAGVTPPVLWFWRGIHQGNLGNWRTDAEGRSCADGDTTMWFISPGNGADGCGGAPACDPDHFGSPDFPCTGVDCCWRNWDDPRGPELRVSNSSGPVEVHNWGAKGLNGNVPEFGFGVTVCAPPGTVASIDTCPRADVYSCVQDRYPQFVDDCTTVLLTVKTPPPQYPVSVAGCYSTKADVTITF